MRARVTIGSCSRMGVKLFAGSNALSAKLRKPNYADCLEATIKAIDSASSAAADV